MKYYAVRKGRMPGIYTTWNECKKQVEGYSGAEYKSFVSEWEAKKFVYGLPKMPKSTGKIKEPYAYVDGSFNNKAKLYGCGVLLVANNGQKYEATNNGNDSEMLKMHNVAGEILGVYEAVNLAIRLGLKSLTIIHDYEGLAKWVEGSWKCNKEATRLYRDFVLTAKQEIDIQFIWVRAHAGIQGNERADQLAKAAVGF